MNIKQIIPSSCFTIGSSHDVCEDFAYHNNNTAILSDGCSSSINTDIGARVICCAMANYLDRMKLNSYKIDNNKDFVTDLCVEFIRSFEQLGFEKNFDLIRRMLYATVACVHKNKNGDLISLLYGDGIVFWKNKDIIHIISSEYDGNIPYYMIYGYDQKTQNDYCNYVTNQFGSTQTQLIEYQTIDIQSKTVVSYFKKHIDFDTPVSISFENNGKDFIIHSFIEDSIDTLINRIDVQDIEFVGVGSDGIFSFYNDKFDLHNPCIFRDVMLEISKIKNTTLLLEILAMKRHLSIQRGIVHYDDLSIAGMFINQNLI